MGWVDRRLDAVPGTHIFEIHLSLENFVTTFIRIQHVTVEKELDTQLVALFGFLEGLMIPTECIHLFFEHKFEVEYDANKLGCGEFCTFCRNEHLFYTGKLYLKKLKVVLAREVMVKNGRKMYWAAFTKVLKVHKEESFVTGDMPGTAMGPIHGFILQLLAKGVFELRVSDKAKAGGDKENNSHAEIGLTAKFLESNN